MGTLEFSPELTKSLAKNIVFPTSNAVTLNVSSLSLYPMIPKDFDVTGSGELLGYVKIMKGTPPVGFSGLTQTTSRSSDVLVTFTMDDTDVFEKFSNFETNPVVIETTYQQASASGTATWFWWVVTETDPGSNIIGHQIVGTIGTVGSGSDLEMLSTTIESGKYYRVSNLKFLFPNTYTTV